MKVTTIGGAMIDSIAIVASERIERMGLRNADTSYLLLEEGKKTEAERVSTHVGGGAVNAAVCFARLGWDATALVKLGQDDRADQVLTRLAAEKISTRFASRDARQPTGASVLISSHDRNAAVFTFRGANTLIEPDDLKDDAFGVDLVNVSGLSNKSAECFSLIVEKAKAAKAWLSVNPGIRQLSLQSGGFLQLLDKVDILSINRAEADTLVAQIVAKAGEGGPKLDAVTAEGELPALAKRGFQGGGFEVSMARFFTTLLGYGVRHVIVTDGGRGAYAASSKELVHCPASSGPVAGTAGAGDAFVATFAASITKGVSAGVALQRAALNAGSVIEHPDTQSGLLTAKALDERHARLGHALTLTPWRL